MKLSSVNYISIVFLTVNLLNLIKVSLQLPDGEEKVSNLKVSSDSKISDYEKSHGSHKAGDSNGWKNLQSSSKGKLDKSKQDEEMFLGEDGHKVKKGAGFHSESGGHKSKDKGLDKKWNRGDGTMKTWNWNKGGHLEEEEGGKWKTTLHHSDSKGKKIAQSKKKESDTGGSHLESSGKKYGSKEGSKKKMEINKKKEKQSEKWKNGSGKSSDSKMEKKFHRYEKPMKYETDFKGKSHPFGYKGVDHGSIHGGRLSSSSPISHHHHQHNQYSKENVIHKKINHSKKDKFDSLDDELESSIDKNLPDELKSLKDMDEDEHLMD